MPFLPFSDTWVNIAKGPSDRIEIFIIDCIDEKISDPHALCSCLNPVM